VAISVDTPDESRNLCHQEHYTYPFLSDAGAAVIRRYGIVHQGMETDNKPIARPAELLVDRTGTVRWRNLTEDIRVRARAEEMLAAAKGL